MRIKTSFASGLALDYLVAKCEGIAQSGKHQSEYKPSSDWSLGGAIIEREGIEVHQGNPLYFPQGNEKGDYYEPLWIAGKVHGQTQLIAAMRYHVTSKLGDTAEVPDALLSDKE